jgi:hypothetical protein
MIEDGFAIGDSPLSASVLGYSMVRQAHHERRWRTCLSIAEGPVLSIAKGMNF